MQIATGAAAGFFALFVVARLSTPPLKYFCRYLLENEGDKQMQLQEVPVDATTVHPQEVYKRLYSIGLIKSSAFVTFKSELSGVAKIVEFNFQEGEQVEKDQLLIRFDDKEAQGRLNQAISEYEKTKSKFAMIEKLFKQGHQPKAEFDKAKGDFDLAQGRIEEAKAQLDKTTIYAPFSGTIGIIENLTVGSVIQPNTPIVTLVNDKKLYITAKFPAKEIDEISLGQTVIVKVEAFPNKEFEGTVTAIDSKVETESHTILIQAEINNGDTALKHGMICDVQLITGIKTNAFIVPESSLIRQGENDYVYIIQKGKAVIAQVIKGSTIGTKRVIESGLHDGDMVINVTNIRLREGSPVIIKTLDGEKYLKDEIQKKEDKNKQKTEELIKEKNNKELKTEKEKIEENDQEEKL